MEHWPELRRLQVIDRWGSASSRGVPACIGESSAALRNADPPKYTRPRRPSKLDAFKPEVHRLLKDDSRLPVVRMRELLAPLGSAGEQQEAARLLSK